MGIFCGHKVQLKTSETRNFVAKRVICGNNRGTMSAIAVKSARGSLLKVRVRDETKERIIEAARLLDLDQSTLIRLALQDYLARKLPHAA